MDEMDDIDKVRDDLQSTKQLLAFELRNKEAQIRENKKLLAKIQNLEAELEKAKASANQSSSTSSGSEADEKVTLAGTIDASVLTNFLTIIIKIQKLMRVQSPANATPCKYA